MIKVLFICHGNICRSPMAEFVMKKLVSDAGLTARFQIASAATSTEEIWNGIGNPVYPPARRKLLEQGIPCGHHAARQMTRADYDRFDLLIGMDRSQSAHHAAHLRRRSGRKAAFAAGFYRPKRRGGRRPMVYRRF